MFSRVMKKFLCKLFKLQKTDAKYLPTDMNKIEQLFTDSSKRDRPGRGKSSTKSKPAVSSKDSQVAVGGKDASLFLFRALGKVLYCKREYRCF